MDNSRAIVPWCGLVRRFSGTVIAVILSFAAAAASNVVEYAYDAAGNITQIQRQSAAGFAITSVDPDSGAVGAAVTIYGAGFSATPANNTVKFNGTTASVSASDSGSISTTVPAGATSGRITVTVGGNTVTSPHDFVVVVPGAPTITSFNPVSGAASTSVTVTGTNFNTSPSATTVTLNGVPATATVTSATSLSFAVPASTASGRIGATTSVGTGYSAQDFVVPPSGVSAADIVVLTRIQTGGSAAGVSVPPSSKHALVLFDGVQDSYYTLQFGQYGSSPSIAATAYKVIRPDNTVLVTGSVGTTGGNRPTIHLPKLPMGGTYTLLLSPGSATFDSNISLVADPVLTLDGSAASIALGFQGQTARMAFQGTAGQKIGMGLIGLTLVPSSVTGSAISIYKPDGTLLSTSDPCYSASGGNCDTEIDPTVTGVHTAILNVVSTSAASFSAQISSEVTGTITLGSGQDMALTRVGQDARYSFTAAAGDSIGVDVSGIATEPAGRTLSVTVRRPNGTVLSSLAGTQPGGAYAELGNVATAGTYSIYVDPSLGAYGTARLNVKQGTVLAPADPPIAFAAANVAETMRFRFSGTAGQSLTVGVTDLAYIGSSSSSANLTVYKPDGTTVGFAASCNPTQVSGRCRVLLSNLPATGTYSVVLPSPSGVKATGNALISSDVTGTLTIGTASSVSATRPGQAARLTFSGTSGASLAVKVYGMATTPSGHALNVSVLKPDGLVLPTIATSSTNARSLDIASLPSSGTYTVLIDPPYALTWQASVIVDAGTALTLNGTMPTLATSAAGEPLRYTFAATSGQRLEFGLSGLAHSPSSGSTAFTLIRPDGNSQSLTSCSPGTGCEAWVTSLPNTGTYSLIVMPPSATSITAGTMGLSTPTTGTFTIDAAAQALSIDRPGQTLRYTFSGTAAQLLRLTWSGTTITGGTSVGITVLKPDGTSLTTGSFGTGATGNLNIASLPTTGTYTVVLDPATAATMTANIALVTQ